MIFFYFSSTCSLLFFDLSSTFSFSPIFLRLFSRFPFLYFTSKGRKKREGKGIKEKEKEGNVENRTRNKRREKKENGGKGRKRRKREEKVGKGKKRKE